MRGSGTPWGNFGFLTATHTPPGHSPTEWEGQQKPQHSLNYHLDASAPPPCILSGPCGVLSGALLSRADWHCTWAPARKGQDRTWGLPQAQGSTPQSGAADGPSHRRWPQCRHRPVQPQSGHTGEWGAAGPPGHGVFYSMFCASSRWDMIIFRASQVALVIKN